MFPDSAVDLHLLGSQCSQVVGKIVPAVVCFFAEAPFVLKEDEGGSRGERRKRRVKNIRSLLEELLS